MVFIRPDIYLALSKLSQYMNNPAKYYKIVVKYILRYLRSNSDLYIRYKLTQKDQKHIFGYSDSNFADDVDTRRSTLDYVFLLRDGVVSWASR